MHPITKMLAEVDEALHELDRGRHEQVGHDVQLAIDVMLRDLGFTEFEWPSQHGIDRSDILAERWERDNVDHEYISPNYKFLHRSFVLEEYRPSTKEWSPIYVESLTFLRGYLASVKDQLAVHPEYRIVEEDKEIVVDRLPATSPKVTPPRSYALEMYHGPTLKWLRLGAANLPCIRRLFKELSQLESPHPAYRVCDRKTGCVVAELLEKTITQACEERQQAKTPEPVASAAQIAAKAEELRAQQLELPGLRLRWKLRGVR